MNKGNKIGSIFTQFYIICSLFFYGCGGLSELFQSPKSDIVGKGVETLNHPPTLDSIGDKRVNYEKLLEFVISASDPDDDDLIYSGSNLPTSASFNPETGVFSWRPQFQHIGNYRNVQFSVTDKGTPSGSDSETISICVNDTNRPPVLASIGNQVINEGELFEFQVSAIDPDDDEMVYSAGSLPSGAVFDEATQIFSWTPDFVQTGNYKNIVFIVTDNGVPSKSDVEVITITVGNVNRPPDLDPIGNMTVSVGDLLEFRIVAIDPEGNDLIYSASNLPTGAIFTAETRTFSWIPVPAQAGNYKNVIFSVIDNGLPAESDSETIVITVGDVNRPPVITAIAARTVNEEEPLGFTVTAMDPDGDNMVYFASNLPTGSVFNSETHFFSWTPGFDQSGNYSDILFTVSDSGLPTESCSQAISITVGNVNRPPVLDPIGNKMINEGEFLEFTITSTDPDGDNLINSASNLPPGASFNSNTGVFSWMPNYTQTGNYLDILFSVSDDNLPSEGDFEVITITVGNIDRPPELDPIGNKTVNEGELLEFNISATDPDGDDLIYSADNLPAGAVFNPITKVFNWTPNYTQTGNYSNVLFTVVVDGKPEETDFEVISITVGDVNRQPVLTPVGNQTCYVGVPYNLILTANDPDGDSLIYSVIDTSTQQIIVESDTGIINWTPDSASIGEYNYTITVTDNGTSPLCDSEDITLVVKRWWDTSWNFRRRIAITEQSSGGDLVDYQTMVSLNSSFDFTNANASGDDVRVTYQDTATGIETETSFWLERWNSVSEEAEVWVKVPYVASNSIASIYIYYGNGSANPVSSFDNTFIKDVSTSGLVGHWHMDEGSGTAVFDSSGNNNTGTCHNTAWVSADGGRWGNSSTGFSGGDSLYFDGGSDYVLVSDSSSLDVGQITIEAWFKADRLTSFVDRYKQYIVSKWIFTNDQRSFGLFLDRTELCFNTSFDGDSFSSLSGGSISTGNWYHIAATFDGSTKRIFLNGVELKSETISGTLFAGSAPLTIGIRSDLDNDRDFKGIIDEVIIYSRALSAGEIWAHFERRRYANPEPEVFIDSEEAY